MSEITIADLQAIGDVAKTLAEQSDSLSAEQAITLLAEAKQAAAALKLAIDMLEARALAVIEQPVLIGHTVYAKKPSFKKRPDQVLIQRCVVGRAAAPDDDGVLPTVHEAAALAVDMMAALYVSPSTLPKVGGVKALGLEMDAVCAEEHTGYELKMKEV